MSKLGNNSTVNHAPTPSKKKAQVESSRNLQKVTGPGKKTTERKAQTSEKSAKKPTEPKTIVEVHIDNTESAKKSVDTNNKSTNEEKSVEAPTDTGKEVEILMEIEEKCPIKDLPGPPKKISTPPRQVRERSTKPADPEVVRARSETPPLLIHPEPDLELQEDFDKPAQNLTLIRSRNSQGQACTTVQVPQVLNWLNKLPNSIEK